MPATKNLALFLTLTAAAALGLTAFGQRQEIARLRDELDRRERLAALAETARAEAAKLTVPEEPADPPPTPTAAPEAPAQPPAPPSQPEPATPPPQHSSAMDFMIESRLSAIEKLVKIDDGQRERLRRKFNQEAARRRGEAGQEEIESLEQIIGQSDAEFYRSEMRKAFDRGKQEAVEKEVLWLSRRLSLDRDQEARLESAMIEAERRADEAITVEAGQSPGVSPRERMKRIVRENELREQFLGESLKQILTPEQYAEYAKTQADSSAQDIGVWHAVE